MTEDEAHGFGQGFIVRAAASGSATITMGNGDEGAGCSDSMPLDLEPGAVGPGDETCHFRVWDGAQWVTNGTLTADGATLDAWQDEAHRRLGGLEVDAQGRVSRWGGLAQAEPSCQPTLTQRTAEGVVRRSVRVDVDALPDDPREARGVLAALLQTAGDQLWKVIRERKGWDG